MLDVFLTALASVVTLFIFVIGGWAMRRTGMVDDAFSAQLSRALFNFFLPCLMCKIILLDFDVAQFSANWPLMLISVAVLLSAIPLSLVVAPLFKNRVEPAPIRFALMYSNFMFMGLPVTIAVLGEGCSFSVVMYTLPISVLVSTLGYMILASGGKAEWRKLLNPCTIAAIVGAVMLALPFDMPKTITDALVMGGNVVSPMAMFSIGLVIGGHKFSELGDLRDSVAISLIRLIAIPALLFGILYACGLRGYSLGVPVLIAAMPVAVNMTMTAGAIGRYEQISTQLVFVSTVMSLVTLPLVACLISLA